MASLYDLIDPSQMPSQMGAMEPNERAALRLRAPYRNVPVRPYSATTDFLAQNVIPQTPLDYASMFALGPAGRAASIPVRAGLLGMAGALTSDEAEAGPLSAARKGVGRLLKIGQEAPPNALYPGVYQRPDVIATEAAARVAPEHPALKELFGVTRGDLYDISQQGRRAGNVDPVSLLRLPANPKGSYVGEGVATPENAQRLINALGEAETRAPELVKGMDAWYVMDPLYQRMVQLVGPEQAARDYVRFNTLGSMASPGSEVMTEINRGTAANMMAHQGQFPVFLQHGGTAAADRGRDFPAMLRGVQGHAYHSTAQAQPMANYLQGGAVDMTSPKVPLYIGASGVPETGFQTALPVADAHFTRAIGASDVRAAQGHQHPGVSMKTPEYMSVGPWFREAVAKPLGIEAVPGQARLWGLMSQYTGVETPIGAPKLELLAQRIWERAKQRGIDPRVMRDYVLRGGAHAGLTAGIVGPGLASRPDEE